MLGGMVGKKGLALIDRETVRMIERYRADKAFLGSSGFTSLHCSQMSQHL